MASPTAFDQYWRMAALTVADLNYNVTLSKNRDLVSEDVPYVRLVRPSYQRALVWKKERARDFRRSLSNGYPFGVLVLAHEGEKNGVAGMAIRHHSYTIIDGQQRIYWLNEMRQNFFSDGWFIDADAPQQSLVEHVHDLLEVLGRSALPDAKATARTLIEVMREPTSQQDPGKLLQTFIRVSDAVAPITMDKVTEALGAATELWKALTQLEAEFAKLSVPALIVEKQLADHLPDVFVKLNSGVRLSRFDIFAADWALVELDLDHARSANPTGIDGTLADKLVSISQHRLSDADVEDSDYEVQLSGNEGVINLYEYLYSLSQLIAQKHPHTLGSIPKAADELVLNVAAMLFAGDISKMDSLAARYPKAQDGGLDYLHFPNAVFAAASAIHDCMSPMLHWDLGDAPDAANPTRKRSLPTAFGLIQAATYMAAYVANTWEVADRVVRPKPAGAGVASTITQFKKALRSWYLLDAVTMPFKGSDAYSNAAARVWTDFQGKQVNPDMLSAVELQTLADQVIRYVESSLIVDATPARRDLNQPASGAILRLAYLHQTPNSNEDRDHVIPVNAFRALTKAPGNHVANWMPLNKTDNRSRQSALWADCIADSRFDDRRNEIVRHLFIDPSAVDSSVVASTDAFKAFLRERYNAMTMSLAKGLQHPGNFTESQVAAAFALK